MAQIPNEPGVFSANVVGQNFPLVVMAEIPEPFEILSTNRQSETRIQVNAIYNGGADDLAEFPLAIRAGKVKYELQRAIQVRDDLIFVPTTPDLLIVSIEPDKMPADGENVAAVIGGEGFDSSCVVTISGTNVTATVTEATPTTLTVTLNAAIGAAATTRDVTVTKGAETDTLIGGLTILSSPVALTVTSMSPSSIPQGTTRNYTVVGTGFVSGAAVTLSGTGLTVNSTTYDTPNQLTANVTAAVDATESQRNVTVTLPNTSSVTLTNGVTVTVDTTIYIDSDWLTANGPSPYYLDTAGATYELSTNVTTHGTAFAIIASNITFDLGIYTITYDNSTPIVIPNGSFESGTGGAADDWDFTNAPNADRFAGIFLQNEIYDGDYSLRFNDATQNEYVESAGTITLDANTTYSLSGMFEYGGGVTTTTSNPGVKGYVQLVGDVTREVFFNTTNWRGIQLREHVFTTGGTPETYTVRVGIEGHANATAPFFIDDVKIQRTRNRGIYVGPTSWAGETNTGDITQFGTADYTTIKNGTITQGSGASTWAHSIAMTRTRDLLIDNVNATIYGANSSSVWGHDQLSRSIIVSNSNFTSNVTTITSRDNINGAMFFGVVGTFSGNLLENGPHVGINADFSVIEWNTIRLKTRYTNAFAIRSSGAGTIIRNNVIEGFEGEYASRGIQTSGSANADIPVLIHDNTVRVRSLNNNQEYQGDFVLGAYAIQLEDFRNVKVYDNGIYSYGGVRSSYALRMTNALAAGNAEVYDNHIEAISIDGGRTAPISAFGVAAGRVSFWGNTLKSNRGIIGPSVNANFTLVDTTIDLAEDSDTSRMFEADYSASSALNSIIQFVDTTFNSPATREKFEDAIVVAHNNLNANNQLAFNSQWTTTFHAVDSGMGNLVGAAVSVESVQEEVVASGVTGAGGLFVAEIKEFQTQGNTKTINNDHSVFASSDSLTYSGTATINSTSTIQIGLT